MRRWHGGFLVLAVVGCASGRSEGGAPQSAEPAECAQDVERARVPVGDSLFRDARGLIARCPDAMTTTLSALWREPQLSPHRARSLRAASALLRDERLVSAVEGTVRDVSRPVESRAEALSTLSYYLQAGRWIEFTFLKDVPDSASLRMFMGVMEHPILQEGGQPIPAGYGIRFRQMLEMLRDSDSSSAIRSAARRFLVFLDFVRSEQQKTPPAPAPAPVPPPQ